MHLLKLSAGYHLNPVLFLATRRGFPREGHRSAYHTFLTSSTRQENTGGSLWQHGNSTSCRQKGLKPRSQRTAKWGAVYTAAVTARTDWSNGSEWQVHEGLGGSGTVGLLLLDLNEGTLSVFKNGRRLGVIKDGLGGEYIWFVPVSSGCTIKALPVKVFLILLDIVDPIVPRLTGHLDLDSRAPKFRAKPSDRIKLGTSLQLSWLSCACVPLPLPARGLLAQPLYIYIYISHPAASDPA